MNPITPQDLFSPDFQTSLSEIRATLESTAESISKGLDNVKTSAKGLANVKFTSTQAEETKKWANSVLALNDEYRYLLQQFHITKSTLAEITTLERDQNAILKLQSQYANAAEGSYNKLYAEYRLLVITMRAMNQEALGNTEAFKKIQKRAAELHDALNKSNQAVGDFRMQVGDYSKALNGLQLSTNQIVREMPTLANSLSQFFMAISNNVPIFIDNFQRAQKELGSFRAALKETLVVLGGWQTWLLLLLTVLPKITKAIHDKRKAQQEANKETKEAYNIEKEYLSLQENIAKTEAQSVARLKSLYSITQDTTRSLKERTEATKTLKELYPDHLSNLSEEAILEGRAATAVDQLTNALVMQARARGYLNEIESLSQKKAQKEIEKTRLEAKKTSQESAIAQKEVAAGGKEIEETWVDISTGQVRTTMKEVASAEKEELRGTKAEITLIDSELQDVENTIDDIIKLIPTEGLAGLITSGRGGNGGKKAKEDEIGEIPDYLIAFYDSVIKGMEDGNEKMILQRTRDMLAMDKAYQEDYAKLAEQERIAIEKGNQEAIDEIHRQMELRRRAYEAELERLPIIADVMEETVMTDPLAMIRNDYWRAMQAQAGFTKEIQKGIQEGRQISAEEQQLWQSVIRRRIEIEAEYKKAEAELSLRKMLEEGKITQTEYEQQLGIEAEKIDVAARKALSKVGKAKGKKWNLWTALFGTDIADETTGTVTRVIGEDVKYALDQTANGYKQAIGFIDEYIDALQREAEQAIETARTEADLAKTVLEAELEAKANGYANSVDLARKEYEEKLALQEKAQKESEKIQKVQLAMESLSQAANLTTATTSIIASYASLPGIGQALAAAAIIAMWGTFLTAKAKAFQVTKYGEGMSEYLDYGGSHASGNDIDFGVAKNGRRRRVERGEVIGVINKRRVSKYGASTVTGIIDSLNKGTFEYKYGNAFRGAVIAPNGANLSHLENGVDALVRQGEYRETVANGRRIIQYKNLTRTVH